MTLRLQARETKLVREEARRQAIVDLLKMAMDDPDLSECWGPTGLSDPPKIQRQQMYVNMIISEWRQSYETKTLPEVRLRAIANEMFHGTVGRDYWQAVREVRLSTSGSRPARRFHVIHEEYRRALASPLTVTPRPVEVRGRLRPWSGGTRQMLVLVAAGVGAVAVLRFVRYLRTRTTARQ